MYKNIPDLDTFEDAFGQCNHSVCYNGDIFTTQAYEKFVERFPKVDKVMLGRGMLINPGLAREIRTGIKTDKETLRAFHDEILENYKSVLSGDKTILFKMNTLPRKLLHYKTPEELFEIHLDEIYSLY